MSSSICLLKAENLSPTVGTCSYQPGCDSHAGSARGTSFILPLELQPPFYPSLISPCLSLVLHRSLLKGATRHKWREHKRRSVFACHKHETTKTHTLMRGNNRSLNLMLGELPFPHPRSLSSSHTCTLLN